MPDHLLRHRLATLLVLTWLAFPALASPLPSTSSSGVAIAIPLSRRAGATYEAMSAEEHYEVELASIRRTGRKFGVEIPVAENEGRREKRQSAIDMANAGGDLQYYGTIHLGTPPVSFSTIMDTGSSDLIIAVPPCDTGCKSTTPLYDAYLSSTSETSDTQFNTVYGSGAAQGILARDTMSMGGLELTEQVFGAIANFTNIVQGDTSGILGLAWSGIASSRSKPFVQRLWEKGMLAEPMFGFGFARQIETAGAYARVLPGGVMTLGGVNETLYEGEIDWIPLPTVGTYWPIPLLDVKLGGNSLGISYGSVLVDTGTSLIGMPASAVNAIYEQIPGSRVQSSGQVIFPCDTDVELSFTFGTREWIMRSVDFNIGPITSRGTMCLGAVFTLPPYRNGQPLYIFGDAFLKNVYSAFRFDPPAIGFASLSESSDTLLKSMAVPASNATTVEEMVFRTRNRTISSDRANNASTSGAGPGVKAFSGMELSVVAASAAAMALLAL